MSERLTRRQMRELGLLKPKQAPERRDIPDDEANPAPVAPDAAEDDRTVATPDSAVSAEDGHESTQALDAVPEAAEPVAEESAEQEEPTTAPSRTSVFDRFEPSSPAEKRSAGAALGAGVVPPAHLADSEAEGPEEVEDYSEWLRSRMNADSADEAEVVAPSAESASTAGGRRARRAAAEKPEAAPLASPAVDADPGVDEEPVVEDHVIDDHDDDEIEPDRPGALRTFLGFVILILLGLGIGILVGQLIFGGGDSNGAPADQVNPLESQTSISGDS